MEGTQRYNKVFWRYISARHILNGASDFFFYLINQLMVEMWHLQVSQTALRFQHVSRRQVLFQQKVHLKPHTENVQDVHLCPGYCNFPFSGQRNADTATPRAAFWQSKQHAFLHSLSLSVQTGSFRRLMAASSAATLPLWWGVWRVSVLRPRPKRYRGAGSPSSCAAALLRGLKPPCKNKYTHTHKWVNRERKLKT